MLLSGCMWEKAYSAQSYDEAFDAFYDEFLYYFNICFPLKQWKPRKTGDKCWVSGNVIHASQYMKDLYTRDKQLNNDEFHRFYLTVKKDYKKYVERKKVVLRWYYRKCIQPMSRSVEHYKWSHKTGKT